MTFSGRVIPEIPRPNANRAVKERIPAAMKVPTATIDLSDILLIPQTPWPLVQPFYALSISPDL